MPVTAQDDIKEVFQLLRRPSQEELSWQDALSSLGRQYALRNKQFQLSDKNWFLRSVPLTPNATDELLNIDDWSVPVKVTTRSRTAQPTDRWYPVEIINADEVERAIMESRSAIAFYGTPARAAFTMDVTDQAFTIWYEPSATRPTKITDTPEIESDFNTLLVYDTVLECGGQIQNDSKEFVKWWNGREPYFIAKVGVWEAVMNKWMKMGRNQGRAYKRSYPLSNRGNYYPSEEFKRR